ncbi:hypothetical protein PR001_g21039 [Phytophthora rubi]|uniref:Uncharacterized protein n=1 Tax=Phytophthora rubi TaxID=129364 RepID=A0A6A3JF40_9STRA|nr:hypothetical protein PR001_g21039 [Phytophthora rubi]
MDVTPQEGNKQSIADTAKQFADMKKELEMMIHRLSLGVSSPLDIKRQRGLTPLISVTMSGSDPETDVSSVGVWKSSPISKEWHESWEAFYEYLKALRVILHAELNVETYCHSHYGR